MSEVDDFLLSGNSQVDETLGTQIMVCEGQTFNVVWNDARKSFEGALGGLESMIQASAVAQPGDVANPLAMLKKRCIIDGDAFRIAEISIGTVAITFILTSINNSK